MVFLQAIGLSPRNNNLNTTQLSQRSTNERSWLLPGEDVQIQGIFVIFLF